MNPDSSADVGEIVQMSSGGARIASVHVALPPNRYEQQDVTETLASIVFDGDEAGRGMMDRFHASAGVANRHLTLPLERYADISGFGEANDAFIEGALDYGADAVEAALREAGLRASDVDLFVATSVTGVAVPSVDARLAGRLGMRPDVKRLPLFGLGCVAGAAGLARVHDYLLAWPDHVAVLLSVELCSLTWQRTDRSPANLVASALFGDGAAAVVCTGRARGGVGGPGIVATRSRLYPDTERVMGWDVGDSGFSVVLGADVPDVVRRYLADDVHAFLADHGLTTSDIRTWVCHPGGPKVLEAVQDALDLPPDALGLTWRSLRDVGNLSSASVLYVLRDTLAERPQPAGSHGVLLAMGPGFCAELVLFRW